jgi:hypothetical protein
MTGGEKEWGWVSSKYVTATPEVDRRLQEGRIVHQRAILAFIWIGVAGFAVSLVVAFRHSGLRGRRGWAAQLLFHPKSVISWFILLESGIGGLIFLTGGMALSGRSDFGIAAFFAYFGWALFWGLPAFWRWVRKVGFWLMAWYPPSIVVALFFLVPLAISGGVLYSVLGGGLFHFSLHCWKVLKIAASAPQTLAEARQGEDSRGAKIVQPKQGTAQTGSSSWQVEHPEW